MSSIIKGNNNDQCFYITSLLSNHAYNILALCFRYLVFCLLPKYLHSIAPSFKMSLIFGQDILKYTLKAFRMHLTDWCHASAPKWSNHRKHFCMSYLPK